MADQESAIKSLQQEVTCPACKDIYCDPYKTPKKLPCDHVFCLECLHEFSLKHFDNRLVCPRCHASSPVPDSDASLFPTAHRVCRLIDIYHQALQEHSLESIVLMESLQFPIICSLHNSQPLVLDCETCQKTVCRDCVFFLCAHKDHRYGFLEKEAKNYQNELDNVLKPIRELCEEIEAIAVTTTEAENAILEEWNREEVDEIEAANRRHN